MPPVYSPFSSILTQANPFAPASSFAKTSILSKNLRPWDAPFGTIIIFTVLPLKALNSVFLNISVASCIISGFLKSGLSIPYFSIASKYGILINGPSSTCQVVFSLNTYGTTSSATSKTSSCVAKLIS